MPYAVLDTGYTVLNRPGFYFMMLLVRIEAARTYECKGAAGTEV